MSNLVVVDVDSDARRSELSDSLRNRLERKRTRHAKAELDTRLEAAELRRRVRLEAVRQRAIDSRPTILPDMFQSFSDSAASICGMTGAATTPRQSCEPTLTPPSPSISHAASSFGSTPPSFSQVASPEPLFSSSASAEFWRTTHSLSISAWPEALCNASFETKVIDLPRQLVSALSGADGFSSAASGAGGEESLRQALEAFEAEIDSAIAAVGGEAFAKLSSRSAKDDALLRCDDTDTTRRETLHARLRERLAALEAPEAQPQQQQDQQPSTPDSLDLDSFMRECEADMGIDPTPAGSGEISGVARANTEAVCVLEAASNAMVQTSGLSVLKQFAGSSRVSRDLKKALLPSSDPDVGMQLMVRRFDRRVTPDSEWRCFVHRGKLTAVSQYHHHCYFENHPRDALARIEAFVVSLIPHFPLSSCVADVALTADGCVLIELNPFHHTTEACLFDWCSSDVQVLVHGESVPEGLPGTPTASRVAFRRRTCPLPAKDIRKHISRDYALALDMFWHEATTGVVVPSPSKRSPEAGSVDPNDSSCVSTGGVYIEDVADDELVGL